MQRASAPYLAFLISIWERGSEELIKLEALAVSSICHTGEPSVWRGPDLP